jgi:L-threonylcarbamoyladenylate synthase
VIKNYNHNSDNHRFITNTIDEDDAISALDSEDLVILPTETVYGLAGVAYSHHAVKKIFDTKRRPYKNPLIVHYYSIEQIESDVFFTENARKIGNAFWPGPITIVVYKKRSSKLSSLVCANKSKIAVRVPFHIKTLSIIKKLQKPLAMPSANLYQRISNTNISDAVNSLKTISGVDGGYCVYGIESTIIDCTTDIPTILRHGAITAEMIYEATGIKVSSIPIHNNMPGSHKKHYSTRKPIRLNAQDVREGEGLIAFGKTELTSEWYVNISDTGNLKEAARKLFYSLQKIDKSRCTSIAIIPIPNEGVGIAINDRLKRASYKDENQDNQKELNKNRINKNEYKNTSHNLENSVNNIVIEDEDVEED